MKKKWWHEAVIYEIYCRSFCDSNGDGIGDLRGVISKLPVLKELGINCIWFAPIYKSPQIDNGYDVSDYQDIEPDYGTLADFKELLDLAHGMGIRVIMDMVLNHSSDEHRWFQEARKAKDSPYRNYYIWQPPKSDGSEPNNWGNYFREGSGSAWEYDELTEEYYLHQYSIKMPDLNWEYEPLRKEIYKMLHWWLDFGVDGFRLDIFTRLKKPKGFPNTEKAPNVILDRNGFVVDTAMCTNVEGIHDILHELYTEVFGVRECVTVGEGAGVTSQNALGYVDREREEINMVYHFELASRHIHSITPEHFRRIQTNWADVIRHNGWAVQHMSNHDSARQVSCYGNDEKFRVSSAKLLATLIHTTPGTPIIYQGEEIGMVNVKFDDIKDYNCCYTIGDYNSMIKSGVSPEEALKFVGPRSRDNARTPYQWDASENAGFTTGKPWMKLNPRYPAINLENDLASEDSIFNYYQEMIKMRQEHPAIIEGELRFLMENHPQIIMYLRECEQETLLIIANYSNEKAILSPSDVVDSGIWQRLITNQAGMLPFIGNRDFLLPWEAEVYCLIKTR
ncbi:MAG: alpha-glucosidase [Lachnospiraceae bacterium]|nr:alpha-glucosidase [Lachnospiraceae bacterium]